MEPGPITFKKDLAGHRDLTQHPCIRYSGDIKHQLFKKECRYVRI